MPGLGGDPVQGDAGEGGGGGVAGAQGVGGDPVPSRPAARRGRSIRATASPESGSRGDRPAQIRVNSGPGWRAAEGEPGGEGGDRVGGGVLAVGDGDDLAVASWSVLDWRTVSSSPAGLVLDVGEGEGDELGAAHGRGVAEQDDRGVADADRGGAVDGVDDLADLGDAQRAGLAAGCGAVDAAQAAADLADRLRGRRVGRPWLRWGGRWRCRRGRGWPTEMPARRVRRGRRRARRGRRAAG